MTCLFPILAALFVGARTLSRYWGQNFGWDDWLIHLSLLLLLGQTITIYECTSAMRFGGPSLIISKIFSSLTPGTMPASFRNRQWSSRCWL